MPIVLLSVEPVPGVPASACGLWSSRLEMEGCGCDTSDLTDTELEAMVAAASFMLDERTMHQFNGNCTTVARPCFVCGCGFSMQYGLGCDPCGPYPTIDLEPYTPVIAVETVWEGGVELDPESYRVDHWRYLVRLADDDGNNPGWSQGRWDVAFDDPEAGTVVRFTWGEAIPAAGRLAATRLACRLRELCAAGVCEIPANATQVTREGFTIQLEGTIDLLDSLAEVKAFIESVNPKGYIQPARVYDPDASPTTYVTS